MTPYELAKMLHTDLSPLAPKLSSALNRALIDIGEGSMLVGLGPGTHQDDQISFQEAERIEVRRNEAPSLLQKITEIVAKLEEHTSWSVLIDKKPSADPNAIDLLYTIFRTRKRF